MIKLVCMDVDGVMTDGSIFIGNDGEIMKCFNVKDGKGIAMLLDEGIDLAIITARESKIVENRAQELNIKIIFQNVKNKYKKLQEIIKEKNILLEETAYIGDDLADLECIKNVSHSFCPHDAIEIIKNNSKHICTKNGGNGCVREMANKIITEINK